MSTAQGATNRLTNPERIARGFKPIGPHPRDPNHIYKPRQRYEIPVPTQPVQERLSQQVTELVGRANATMERWRRGER